jgi:hypothetical protein
MPWCEECAKYLAPSAMNEDGTCPTCGRLVEEPTVDEDADVSAPWHFKLLVATVIVYLGWRVLQLVGVLAS